MGREAGWVVQEREERQWGEGEGWAAAGELTWMSREKPVCTEPCRMELRVVPTYNVSPRPSATVRTGPKSSGTWAGESREGGQVSMGQMRGRGWR